ncbi:MAG: bifunctional (p)ppGpp synthetase/guanosine-3',5'-bis(diphosphate) 3'-pyrophosphohydrolase [Deltaproteobacteria bacterium]|nr:bifunctional (p)ppGpp synthetase/guanosine-3',5'-bis(diphosphate) 3'-pyrophosphohydrolase [Deltaproteobacteria bacterium]
MILLDDLVTRVRSYHPNADVDLLEKAYLASASAHRGQMRKSGDPYFIHPTSVAGIIAELHLDVASICAGLLHDVAEDTEISVAAIEKDIGREIAQLVDGVTKLGNLTFQSKEDKQAENFRKMLVAMARDIRVLLIKLCDRLDNMRTLDSMKTEAQERISRETMEIYAPLANRLGISWMKSELEDLAFKYLEPDAFASLSQKVQRTKKEQDAYIAEVVKAIELRLAEHGFAVNVSGRSKHLYSIFRKMTAQQCDYEQVYDVLAFRVLTESVADCYAALGVIHSKWTPVPGRFKDYIALPKPNMYQSLHTTVIGPGHERIEVQIRTHEMHRVAEQGIAAHWRYKEKHQGPGGGVAEDEAKKFTWLRQLMEFQKELKDPAEFIDSVKVDLFQDEVYVFTPKGEVRVFPRGATPIDFAFAVHTQVGEHCVGARVNGAIVPLRYKLRNGDSVEILTSPNQHPSKDWLDFAVTSRAKSKIRNYIRAEERDRSKKLGEELLERELHKAGVSLSKLVKNDVEVRRVVEDLKLSSIEELYIGLGYGKVSPQQVIDVLTPRSESGKFSVAKDVREGFVEKVVRKISGKDGGGIRLNGIDDILVRYAKCCNPLPGDEIVGFITRGRGITVHRRACGKAFEADPDRRVEISWDSKAKINRPVQLKVVTANRPGILATVGSTFHGMNVNITEANCRADDQGRAVNMFTFEIGDVNQLKGVMRALGKVQGVVSVERV